MKKAISIIVLGAILILSASVYCGDMSQLKVLKDVNGQAAIGLTTTGYVDAVVLVANTAQTYTVPTNANFLLFSSTANFYVSFGGTATVPTVTTATGANSMLNPTLRSVGANTTVSLVAPTAAIVTIESFK